LRASPFKHFSSAYLPTTATIENLLILKYFKGTVGYDFITKLNLINKVQSLKINYFTKHAVNPSFLPTSTELTNFNFKNLLFFPHYFSCTPTLFLPFHTIIKLGTKPHIISTFLMQIFQTMILELPLKGESHENSFNNLFLFVHILHFCQSFL